MPKLNLDLIVDDKGSVVVKKFGGTVNEVFGAIGKGIPGLLGGAAFGLMARQTIAIADNWTMVTSRLRLVTNSAEELNGLQESLYKLAKDTRGEYGATADMYARIARSTEELHKSQQEVLTVSKAVNQALVVSGASTQEAQAAAIQLAQGLASGRLAGDELKSVLENSPRLARAIADGLGVSIGELRKMGSEGKLTSEKVFGALQTQAAKIGEEFAQMPMTVGQGVGLVSNALGRMINETNKASNGTADIAEGFKYTAELIERITPAVATMSTFIAGSVKELITLGGLLPAINRIAHGDPLIDNHLGKDRVALEEQASLQEEAAAQTELLRKKISAKNEELAKAKEIVAQKLALEKSYAAQAIKIEADLASKLAQFGMDGYEKKKHLLSLEIGDLWNKVGQNEAAQQQIMAYGLAAALQIEQAETEATRKAVAAKLTDYTKYYDEIQKRILDNAALEKQAILEISNLLQQQSSNRKSTEGMLSDLGGQKPSDRDQFDLSRTELAQQLEIANQLAGPDKIKALEDYKRGWFNLAKELENGLEATRQRSGVTGEAIAAEARAAIQAAYDQQQQIMEGQRAGMDAQIENSRQWGAVLSAAAVEANNYIVYLQDTMLALDDTIAAMDTAFTIAAQDDASYTIDYIQGLLDDLHDKTITITTVHQTLGGTAQNSLQTLSTGVLDSFAGGTGFIKQTGPYDLHYGESVNTAAETSALSAGGGAFKLAAGGGGTGGNFVVEGDVNFHLPPPRPGAALPTGPALDRWVRDEAWPALRRAHLVQ